MHGFLEALKTVAGHPLALVGYIGLLATWIFFAHQRGRLQTLSGMLKDVPEADRAALIERELSTKPRTGLSAAQWLEDRRRNMFLVAFIATLVVVVVLVALALYRSAAPRELPEAQLSLRLRPSDLHGDRLLTTTIRAEVENVSKVIAEDVAIQLVLVPGLRITEMWEEGTVHLQSIPGQISSSVAWNLEVNPYEVDEITVRVSARNSQPQTATIPVEGAERAAFAEVPIDFSVVSMVACPGGEAALLSPSRKAVVITDMQGAELRSLSLPDACSEPTGLTMDRYRHMLWVVCRGSSHVMTLPLAGSEEISIPSFPTVTDENGSLLSRTPLSVAAAPDFVACTSTDGEQCLWLFDWHSSSRTPTGAWRAVPYQDDLIYMDCELSWWPSQEVMVMLQIDVIPASLSFFDPGAVKPAPFRTLSGHDSDHVSGITALAPLASTNGLLIDEYGEHVSILTRDGARLQRARLTEEEDWSDGKLKRTVFAVDDQGQRAVAVVNVTDPAQGSTTASVFAADVHQLDSVRALAIWAQCEAIDAVNFGQVVLVLCHVTGANGQPRSVLRRLNVE